MSLTTILMTIISTTLVYSAPLIFTALGGTFSERSGVINVGLEGMMIVGAFCSTIFTLNLAPRLGILAAWLALLIGGICGCLFSLLHAVATINLRADHIISGAVLNMIAPAVCVFLTRIFYNGKGQTPVINQGLGTSTINGLKQIPILGKILFTQTSIIAWIAIIIAVICWYVLYRTAFVLHLRSVGENPAAADTLGINVDYYRYWGVLLSGFLGGLGGAVMAQSITLNFSVSTISGQGFMALAAMIFGKWDPIGSMAAAVFFGLAQSLPIIGAYIPGLSHINSVWFQVAPYLITVIVLAIFFGRSVGPAADGKNYIKSK
ncbi:ABC transporter permease [Bombilactobacillus bombi]|uniref:ABC transporter permease n=1 Tax=Bombilactobacillus bombi TaxID=1303590 RepID=UPI0015E5A4B1|nr:ABC transporter permease [Bombilactobacillus bombi]MBA1434070.1 ABC transporter permease [Bombilactobacillus bombi]